ncbi:hypothetical protein TNCV_2254991 [Trichonephila clavipes]|nr:hypothetical protein TNCV_2254991 [Trichonephila clavipes]
MRANAGLSSFRDLGAAVRRAPWALVDTRKIWLSLSYQDSAVPETLGTRFKPPMDKPAPPREMRNPDRQMPFFEKEVRDYFPSNRRTDEGSSTYCKNYVQNKVLFLEPGNMFTTVTELKSNRY